MLRIRGHWYAALAWGTLLLFAAGAGAQTWTIETIDGRKFDVSRFEIDRNGQVVGAELSDPLHVSDLLHIDSVRSPTTAANGVEIVLTDGGRLRATTVQLEGEHLLLSESEFSGPLPVDRVSGLIWQPHDRVARALAQPLGDSDQVIVFAEESPVVVVGVVESLSPVGVAIRYQNRLVEFPLDQVMALIWAAISQQALPTDRATITTTHGNRLVGQLRGWRENAVAFELTGGLSLTLPESQVADVDFVTDRLAFVSDWTPVDVEQRSWFAPARPWRKDTSITGGPISFRDPATGQLTVYSRGLGVQSYTRLVYRNDSGYDRLLAIVGIDAAAEGRGDCDMAIVGDGVRLWQARVTGNDPPLSIDIDIRNVRQLELVVEPGHQFDLSDHANWANVRLLKSR